MSKKYNVYRSWGFHLPDDGRLNFSDYEKEYTSINNKKHTKYIGNYKGFDYLAYRIIGFRAYICVFNKEHELIGRHFDSCIPLCIANMKRYINEILKI